MRKILALALGLCLTPGLLAQNRKSNATLENDSLKKVILVLRDSLQQSRLLLRQTQEELNKYQLDPAILFSQAENALQKRNIERLYEVQATLVKYHPKSDERSMVDQMVKEITDKMEAIEKAEKDKRLSALDNLKKDEDEVSGITWYENAYFTHYHNTNQLSVYIGQKGKKVALRLLMTYQGKEWIFFDHAYLSFDGKTMQIPFDLYKDKKTDSKDTVWEWADVNVDDNLFAFIKEMSKAMTAQIILSGSKTEKTRTLSSIEMKAIADVLLGYEVLKGE